jgi:hypothetical protein
MLCGFSIAILLLISRNAWFFHDEWLFIDGRSIAEPATWFRAHVQHFVALHVVVYTALVALVGTSTYLPFLAVLFAAHVGLVAAVYVLIDRHVGRGPALVASAILLLLGSGYLNLLWAFQMGPVGSVALAMWGLVVIRERPGLAAVLMTLGISTAAFAIFLIPAAAIYGWSRRATVASLAPVFVFAVWYWILGRGSAVVYGDVPTLSGWVYWLVGGAAAAAEAVTGLGVIGIALLTGAVLLVARVRDRHAAAVGICGLLTEYAVLGLTRQGVNTPAGVQYIYFGAAFLLPVFASAWPAVPRWGRPAFGLLAAIALTANVVALFDWSRAWPHLMAINDPLCLMCPR